MNIKIFILGLMSLSITMPTVGQVAFYCDKADSLSKMEQYNDAIYFYTKCINLKQDTVDAYYFRGTTKAFNTGDNRGAIEDLSHYLKLIKGKEYERGTRGFRNDMIVLSYIAIGLCNINIGNRDEACRNFSKALDFGGGEFAKKNIDEFCR